MTDTILNDYTMNGISNHIEKLGKHIIKKSDGKFGLITVVLNNDTKKIITISSVNESLRNSILSLVLLESKSIITEKCVENPDIYAELQRVVTKLMRS